MSADAPWPFLQEFVLGRARAAQKLAEAGIETSTLQLHLARGEHPDTGAKTLYVLDESSLASTRQMSGCKTAGKPGRGGPASFHQPAWVGLPDSEPQVANQKDWRKGPDSRGRSAQVCTWLSSGANCGVNPLSGCVEARSS